MYINMKSMIIFSKKGDARLRMELARCLAAAQASRAAEP
jgi:hypothetical protein